MMGHYWLDLLNVPTASKWHQFIKDGLTLAEVVVRVDNVAEYYNSTKSSNPELGEFPNVAPPFESFWMEYQMKGLRVGACFRAVSATPENIAMHDMAMFSNLNWILLGVVIMGNQKDALKVSGLIIMGVDKHGAIVEAEDGTAFRGKLDPKTEDLVLQMKNAGVFGPSDKAGYEVKLHSLLLAIYPMLLAVCFMHCKNVELIPRPLIIPKPAKGRKQNRGPVDKFHVLKIDPVKKVLDGEGQAGTKGLKHALHICRGHFKNYKEGRGLFGKYQGLYWWEAHVRGDLALGTVTKDYDVQSPGDKK